MASTRTYTWKAGDQLWFVCARELTASGYDSVSQLAEAIRASNPAVLSWAAADVPAGTIITIPYLTS
jgi:Tfp pilus assembly protein FimV